MKKKWLAGILVCSLISLPIPLPQLKTDVQAQTAVPLPGPIGISVGIGAALTAAGLAISNMCSGMPMDQAARKAITDMNAILSPLSAPMNQGIEKMRTQAAAAAFPVAANLVMNFLSLVLAEQNVCTTTGIAPVVVSPPVLNVPKMEPWQLEGGRILSLATGAFSVLFAVHGLNPEIFSDPRRLDAWISQKTVDDSFVMAFLSVAELYSPLLKEQLKENEANPPITEQPMAAEVEAAPDKPFNCRHAISGLPSAVVGLYTAPFVASMIWDGLSELRVDWITSRTLPDRYQSFFTTLAAVGVMGLWAYTHRVFTFGAVQEVLTCLFQGTSSQPNLWSEINDLRLVAVSQILAVSYGYFLIHFGEDSLKKNWTEIKELF